MYKLPQTPPKMPFALMKSPACTSDMRAAAQTALAQLQSHFATNAAAPAWTITPHAVANGTWYSLEAADVATIPAVISCGRVAAAAKDDLTKLGLDGSPPPTLNYSPNVGLYIMMRQRPAPPPQ
jgi:anaerobic glycerol-3-phosphate dehydrogenase